MSSHRAREEQFSNALVAKPIYRPAQASPLMRLQVSYSPASVLSIALLHWMNNLRHHCANASAQHLATMFPCRQSLDQAEDSQADSAVLPVGQSLRREVQRTRLRLRKLIRGWSPCVASSTMVKQLCRQQSQSQVLLITAATTRSHHLQALIAALAVVDRPLLSTSPARLTPNVPVMHFLPPHLQSRPTAHLNTPRTLQGRPCNLLLNTPERLQPKPRSQLLHSRLRPRHHVGTNTCPRLPIRNAGQQQNSTTSTLWPGKVYILENCTL